MKNQTAACVQCGNPLSGAGLLTDEQRAEVAEAARLASGEGE